MSHIDREMGPVARSSRSVTLLSTIGAFATPLHGALADRPEPWLLRTWRTVNQAIEHAADTVLTWQERARTRHQLLMLDDQLLRDIGLTRLDARKEADKPFWRL
jgi:uncharacterized protein YjiS (DUF1127 family)